ncbi:MAG: hypothetical protein ACEQSA_04655 [Weeksellaceae bacterium]
MTEVIPVSQQPELTTVLDRADSIFPGKLIRPENTGIYLMATHYAMETALAQTPKTASIVDVMNGGTLESVATLLRITDPEYVANLPKKAAQVVTKEIEIEVAKRGPKIFASITNLTPEQRLSVMQSVTQNELVRLDTRYTDEKRDDYRRTYTNKKAVIMALQESLTQVG